MTSVRRALALSLMERYLLIVLALASNIILARLLTPEQIGIYSVSLAVIGIAQVLRDFGIGNFLIQEKELQEAHIRTAFGLSLLLGTGLFLAVFLLASWAGKFYDEQRMVVTLRIVSLNFLVLPFCTISLALLRRELKFGRMIYVNISATIVGTSVTLGLAFLGWGPDSIAIGSVLTNAATGFGAWLTRRERKLLSPSLSAWRKVLSFGAQNSTANVVTDIAMNINDLAIGKILGFSPVAMMSRAQGLTNLFHREVMGAVRNVAYPAFARAHRNGEALEHRLVFSTTTVTAIAWPFYGFLGLYGLEILRLMYGPQWDAALPLVPIFAAGGAVLALSNLINSAMMAAGRIDLVTKSELLFQPIRAIGVIVAALVYQSTLACAIATFLAVLVQTPLLYFFKQRCIPTDWVGLIRGLRSSIKVTAATLLIPGLIAIYFGLGRSAPLAPVTFVLAVLAAGIVWPVSAVAFKHPMIDDPVIQRILLRWPWMHRVSRRSGD